MMFPWYVRLGLWLAQKGGWTAPVATVAQADPRVVAELKAQVEHLSVTLHETRVKLQMRDAAVQTMQDQSQQLEQHAASVRQLHEELAAVRNANAAVASVAPAVITRAGVVNAEADTILSGGEAKRHYVYARLIKDFPDTPRRELGLAIELALSHPPKEG